MTRRATKKREAKLCEARPRRALASTQVERAAVSLTRRTQLKRGEAGLCEARSTPPPRPCVYACRNQPPSLSLMTRRATKKSEAGLCEARPRRAFASTQVEPAAVSLTRRTQLKRGEAGLCEARSTPPPRPCIYACRKKPPSLSHDAARD